MVSDSKSFALSLAAVAAGMVMLAYASAPLYDLFCEVTGFGGATRRAESAPTKIYDRTVTVRFNTDTMPDLPWRFLPPKHPVTLKIGEVKLAAFTAENVSDETILGTATFNVVPDKAGKYFNKIQCFCFEQQTLSPRQKVSMPVSFFIDPAILDDPNAKNIDTITLSYTFFRVK